MRVGSSATYLIIFAPAALHREAWRALLTGQPGIVMLDPIAEPSHVGARLKIDQSTTILIDLPIPQPEVAQQLKTIASDCGLLFLVQSYDLAEIIPLLRAGATGIISRDASVGDLARAIIATGRGEIVLPPELAVQALLVLMRGEPIGPEGPIEPLTDREAEVLRLLAQGLTNKDIAQTLILSVRTIDAHLRSIYGKLNMRSRTEAALWATRHGYGPSK